MSIENWIAENKGTIVDVRTTMEYMGGHVAGSINIPLQELEDRIDEFKEMSAPIILCCASGGRSGQAAGYLRHLGLDAHNAGSWLDVNYLKSKN